MFSGTEILMCRIYEQFLVMNRYIQLYSVQSYVWCFFSIKSIYMYLLHISYITTDHQQNVLRVFLSLAEFFWLLSSTTRISHRKSRIFAAFSKTFLSFQIIYFCIWVFIQRFCFFSKYLWTNVRYLLFSLPSFIRTCVFILIVISDPFIAIIPLTTGNVAGWVLTTTWHFMTSSSAGSRLWAQQERTAQA